MDFWLVTGGGMLAGGLVLLWWRFRVLSQKVEAFTRQQYYSRGELRETTRRQAESIDVLRIHLAQVAAGREPDRTLIHTGRLYHQVSADEARKMIEPESSEASSPLVIVDVRTPREFAHSHIPGAGNLPLEHLETRFQNEIPRDADGILVYCGQGERSRLACDFLGRQGYTNLMAVHDGFQNWTGPVRGTGNVELIRIQSNAQRVPPKVSPPTEQHG